MRGVCTVHTVKHARAIGAARQHRFAARQSPPAGPFTVRNTHWPEVRDRVRHLSTPSCCALRPGVEPSAACLEALRAALVMSRFVGATTVTSGDHHRMTTWTSLAARLASVRAPQGRRMMALDPLSSEHGVLGSAGKASVFAKKASSVRSRCLYGARPKVSRMQPPTRSRKASDAAASAAHAAHAHPHVHPAVRR